MEKGLAELKKDWSVMEEAEMQQRIFPQVHSIVDCVWWFASPPVREVIVACAETEFQAIPKDIHAMLSSAFRGIGHSCTAENGMREGAIDNTNAINGKMSRVHRWWSLVKSEVFKTRYKRPELELPEAPPKWVPHLPKAMFNSTGADPTIPEEELQKILMPKPDWKLFTPTTAKDAVAAWALLRWAAENEMWEKLPEVWRSTTVPAGALLQLKVGVSLGGSRR